MNHRNHSRKQNRTSDNSSIKEDNRFLSNFRNAFEREDGKSSTVGSPSNTYSDLQHYHYDHRKQGTNSAMFSPPSGTLTLPTAGSPPKTRFDTDMNFLMSNQRLNSPSVESNLSFARGNYPEQVQRHQGQRYEPQRDVDTILKNQNKDEHISVGSSSKTIQDTPGKGHMNHNAEDERFLRLAREALVATASNANSSGSMVVDPTIQDLLQRLQYAASPHGNPIGNSENIKANSKGQLMIKNFYQQFPNFSNDIFMGNSSEVPPGTSAHPAGNNQGWNFLIGDRQILKAPDHNPSTPSSPISTSLHDSSKVRAGSIEEVNVEGVRKFLCEKCPMSFRRSSDLKRHEKQHLTIPPNICENCGKGFARKDALKRHMGTLTCKRNAQKELYIDNLSYLKKQRKS